MSENIDFSSLGEACDLFSGFAFKSNLFSDDPKDTFLVKGSNIGHRIIDYAAGPWWKNTDPEKLKRYELRKNDVILAMDRPIVGGSLKFTWIKKRDPNSLLVQRVARLRGSEKLDIKYLRYVIGSHEFQAYIETITTGVNVPHISGPDIKKYRFPLPPLPTQKKISGILSAYDDLIENNLKRIELLEEVAQITYEEWFVRLRFPGHEATPINPETGLPEGWKRLNLSDTCKLTMGQSPKSEFYNFEGKGLPFHQGVKDYGERFPTNACWSTNGTRYAEQGDILFSVRAPVGRLNIASEKMILGRGLAAIRHNKNAQGYLYCLLKKQFFEEDMMGGGAIFNSVTKNDMLRIDVVDPDNKTLENFNTLVNATDREVENLHEQNAHLQEARDILLPRLMTGMIDVEKYNPADLLKEVA